jgi:hypothetical protein
MNADQQHYEAARAAYLKDKLGGPAFIEYYREKHPKRYRRLYLVELSIKLDHVKQAVIDLPEYVDTLDETIEFLNAEVKT